MNKNWLCVPLVLLALAPSAILAQDDPEELILIPKAQFIASYELYMARAIQVQHLRRELETCKTLTSSSFNTNGI